MARAAEIFIGARFGRLVVIGERTTGSTPVAVRCDCGSEKTVAYPSLGKFTNSCGCLYVESIGALRRTHGRSGTPEHSLWDNMKARCHNPANSRYESYGGRGITVCQEWRDSFEAFFAYVGPRPSSKHSMDRIDNDRGYEPGNVRWATASEQARNSRPKLRDTCVNGHPRSPENVRILSGNRRTCRICCRDRSRKAARQRRAREREARTRQNGVEVTLGGPGGPAGPSQLDDLLAA